MSVQDLALLKQAKVEKVSIHLMCRFKITNVPANPLKSYVSIHLMCRFKEAVDGHAATRAEFQYILCVGSS